MIVISDALIFLLGLLLLIGFIVWRATSVGGELDQALRRAEKAEEALRAERRRWGSVSKTLSDPLQLPSDKPTPGEYRQRREAREVVPDPAYPQEEGR